MLASPLIVLDDRKLFSLSLSASFCLLVCQGKGREGHILPSRDSLDMTHCQLHQLHQTPSPLRCTFRCLTCSLGAKMALQLVQYAFSAYL